MSCYFYYELVKKSQLKNKNALMSLIETFDPLLNKYSNKLNYDGAKSDLIIEFIKIINKIPINIINKEVPLNLNLITKYEQTNLNLEDKLILESALLNLSKYQRKVIVEKFIKDKSEVEITKQLGISRQTINKTKNIALKMASSQSIWAVLSVTLIFYVLRAQEKRDIRQEEREKNYQQILSDLTNEFKIVKDIHGFF